MSKKYTYSKTVNGETFSAVEFDSFDEAQKAVEKGIYEANLARSAMQTAKYPDRLTPPESAKISTDGQANASFNPTAGAQNSSGGSSTPVSNSDNGN